MDERDFELLNVLHETKSVTKTGDRLYMTQSAVSKRIRALELQLGCQIFIHTRQGIHFTPQGERLLSAGTVVMNEMKQLRRELENMKQTVSGTLNIGVSQSYGTYVLPDILAQYHRRYPEVRLNTMVSKSKHLYQKLRGDEHDIVILRGEYAWEEEKLLLSEENICLIRSWENEKLPLSEYPYIGRQRDASVVTQIDRWILENCGRNEANTGIQVDMAACVAMVSQGLGWGIVPELCLKHFNGNITPCILRDGTPLTRPTWALCKKSVMELRQVKMFWKLLEEFSTKRGRTGSR